jgi:hypothetical protein
MRASGALARCMGTACTRTPTAIRTRASGRTTGATARESSPLRRHRRWLARAVPEPHRCRRRPKSLRRPNRRRRQRPHRPPLRRWSRAASMRKICMCRHCLAHGGCAGHTRQAAQRRSLMCAIRTALARCCHSRCSTACGACSHPRQAAPTPPSPSSGPTAPCRRSRRSRAPYRHLRATWPPPPPPRALCSAGACERRRRRRWRRRRRLRWRRRRRSTVRPRPRPRATLRTTLPTMLRTTLRPQRALRMQSAQDDAPPLKQPPQPAGAPTVGAAFKRCARPSACSPQHAFGEPPPRARASSLCGSDRAPSRAPRAPPLPPTPRPPPPPCPSRRLASSSTMASGCRARCTGSVGTPTRTARSNSWALLACKCSSRRPHPHASAPHGALTSP